MIEKRILLVSEGAFEGKNLKELLESWNYDVLLITGAKSITKTIESYKPQTIITDSRLSGTDTIELLKSLKSLYEIPVIFVEKDDSIEFAVSALKNGATDYFSKPVDIVRLKKVLENISNNVEIIEESQKLKEQLSSLKNLNGRLIGNSSKIKEIFSQIEVCSPTDASVFISGPSGTGKELVARAIHDYSLRLRGPFIAINCSAIPETLLESEIFGHEKGSFTGATRRKEGCFELANNGTFFLDEITEMAPDLQSKLLRVLEDGTFRRVGGTQEIKSNARIIAASNQNIDASIKNGCFREDLFYRLNVFVLDLPPLKDRTIDIPLLVQHFIEEINLKSGKDILSCEPKAFEMLKNYDWPGNIRELRNVIERAVIVCKDSIISVNDLPTYITNKPDPKGPNLTFEIGTAKMVSIENEIILKTLEHMDGNKSLAAKTLGLSLKTLYNKLNSIKTINSQV